jgi:hypothetical protein
LLLLVWALIKHVLSPREFGVGVLIYWIAMFSLLFVLIRSRQRGAEEVRNRKIDAGVPADDLDRERCVKNIRSMKGLIVAFVIFLAYGLITTRGQSLLPRLVGSAFDVLIVVACGYSLYRSKKRLQELDSAGEVSG